MWFNDEFSLWTKEYLNVYIKWLGDKPVNPQFEVNHKDGTKTYHKSIVWAKFISLTPNLYTTESWWEKKQAKILFEMEGQTYSLTANFTAPTKTIVNTLIWALMEGKVDTFSITLEVKDLWAKKIWQAKITVDGKIPKWAYTMEDVKWLMQTTGLSEEDMWYKLVDDFANKEQIGTRDIEQVLEEEAQKVETKKTKAEIKKEEDTSEMPF